MEGIYVEFFPNLVDPGNNEKKHNLIHIKMITMNKMYVIHMLLWLIHVKNAELGIFVSSISTVLEDADGCANKYIFALDIYLRTVLSSLYYIIMYRTIDAPVHGNNVVDGINETEKH